MSYTDEQVARVAHEANRALQVANGDDNVSPHWEDAPLDQRESSIAGVALARAGATPEEQHESWADFKREQGWVHGDVKDAAAKTHPSLVPYADLPEGEKIKDRLYLAVVNALPG